jgi:hypothetical protein
VLY